MDGVQLRLGAGVTVDARELDALAGEILDSSGAAGAGIDLSRLTAELLPGWHDGWVEIERYRLLDRGLRAIERRAAYEAAQECFTSAVAAICVALKAEPFRESSMLVLLETMVAEGNQVEAVARCLAFRPQIAAVLGVEPSRRLRDLMRRLLDEGTGGGSDAGGPAHVARPVHVARPS